MAIRSDDITEIIRSAIEGFDGGAGLRFIESELPAEGFKPLHALGLREDVYDVHAGLPIYLRRVPRIWPNISSILMERERRRVVFLRRRVLA